MCVSCTSMQKSGNMVVSGCHRFGVVVCLLTLAVTLIGLGYGWSRYMVRRSSGT